MTEAAKAEFEFNRTRGELSLMTEDEKELLPAAELDLRTPGRAEDPGASRFKG